MSGILKITEPISVDTSIDKYDDIEYEPVVGTKLNAFGQDIGYISKLKIFLRIPAKAT